MKKVYLVLMLTIVALVMLFLVQNLQSSTLHFLTFKKELPLSIIGISFYLFGAITGGLIAALIRKNMRNRGV